MKEDFLSRLPVDDTESDVHGSSRITDNEDIDVYFVGASGLWPCLGYTDYAWDLPELFTTCF